MRTEHRRDMKGERGAERRPPSARAGPGARVSARCPCEPARGVDTRGQRGGRADTSGVWTAEAAGRELSAGRGSGETPLAGFSSSCYTKRKFGLYVGLHAQPWPKRHGSQAYI